MKKHTKRVTTGLVIFSLFFLCLQAIVYAESTSHLTQFSKIQQQLLKTDSQNDWRTLFSEEHPSWYPGFLIVQIIKGVIAFILIILILLDIIEPDEDIKNI